METTLQTMAKGFKQVWCLFAQKQTVCHVCESSHSLTLYVVSNFEETKMYLQFPIILDTIASKPSSCYSNTHMQEENTWSWTSRSDNIETSRSRLRYSKSFVVEDEDRVVIQNKKTWLLMIGWQYVCDNIPNSAPVGFTNYVCDTIQFAALAYSLE